jgi:WD40 repeat protein
MEGRRIRHEQEAAMSCATAGPQKPCIEPQLAELLDDAIGSLSSRERDALILRFYHDRSLKQVGATLGINEDAAAQRISRALRHLRGWLVARGMNLPETALLSMVPVELSRAAPGALITKLIGGAAAPGAASQLAQVLSRRGAQSLIWSKPKLVAALIVMGTVTATSVTVALLHRTVTPPAILAITVPLRSFLPTGGAIGATISSDGQRVLASGGAWKSATFLQGAEIRQWDALTGLETAQLAGHTGRVTALALIPPQQQRLISVSEDFTARLWDLASQRELRQLDVKRPIAAMVLSADGRYALIDARGYGMEAPTQRRPDYTAPPLRIWDLQTGEEPDTMIRLLVGPIRMRRLRHGNAPIGVEIAFSPSGAQVAAAVDSPPAVWTAPTEPPALRPRLLKPSPSIGAINCIAYSPDGRLLAAGFNDGNVAFWDSVSGSELPRLKTQSGEIRCMAFSPDGRYLATAGGSATSFPDGPSAIRTEWTDTLVHLWDLQTNREVATFAEHFSAVYRLAFDASGQRLLSAGGQRVLLWDLSGLNRQR